MEANGNPLVSIVVITYNSSKFVLETLESVKAQTHQNIELIVSDDCSTDDTVEICRVWIKVNKVRFVRTELVIAERNTGIPANCNRGFYVSNGEWLKVIAGDDVLLKNCINDNLSFIKKYPDAKFITSKMQNIDENSKLLDIKRSQYDALQKYYFNKSVEKQLKTYARIPLFLNSPAFFIKKDVIVAIDYFDEDFKIYEDMCLIYRINSNNIRVFYIDKYTVKYRIHENAISRIKNNSIDARRTEEQILIFKKYRQKHLSLLNLFDISIYYETWLNYKYKGFFGFKMLAILQKFSVFYWFLKYLNIKFKITDNQ